MLTLAFLIGFAFSASASTSVIQQIPSRGEELQIDGFVEIVFDRAMDRTSVEEAWVLAPLVDGAFEWADERTLRFTPASGWPRDTLYRLTISQLAQSSFGEALASIYEFQFRTVGYLEISQMLPSDGSVAIAVDSTIFVMFNRPVVPLVTLSDPDMTNLPHPLILEPSIPGIGEWLNTSMYVFTPAEPLIGGTLYTATVPSGLTDTTGGIIPADVVWQFATERPEVVWMSPHSGTDLVPVDTSIRITFNMPISVQSFEERFVLRTTGLFGELFSERISGNLTADGNTIIFTPNESLDFNRTYVFSLDAGVAGPNGGLGMEDSLSSRFETVPLPRIIDTDPGNGESSVYPYTSFVITFNAPIDPDTVLENVTISPEPEPSELSGYFRSWDNSYVIRFGSAPSQEYEIRIGPTIADPYGNRTDQPMTIRFRTRALDPTAWLHVPGQTGTFSTYNPARIFVGLRNTESITLTLSRLTLDKYFEATSDWYDYSPPRDSQVRRWTVPVTGELNEIAYAPIDLLAEGESLEAGIYLIDLDASGVEWNRWQHRHLLIASPINLTMKSAANETLVWASDLYTGAPIPGLILRSYDSDGDTLEATVTDRDGVGTFEGTDSYDWRGVTVASTQPFVLGNSQWTSGISIWGFGYSGSGSPDQRLFVDTDRPIYRPGQTVSFRGVLRDEQDAAYSLPNLTSALVTVRDSEWNQIYEGNHEIDAFGTFSGQLELDDDAAIGTYRIEISTESGYFTETFDVAAYRPPEFQVVVTPESDQLVAGQTVRVLVQVDYFFGAPVADQSLDWSVYSASYRFSPGHLGRYSFTERDDPWSCWSCWWLPLTPPTPVLDGTGATNSSGQLLIELPADLALESSEDETLGSRELTIEATARGVDGQVISGRGTITIHAADFYAGLATATSVARAGDLTEVDVITVDWEGERVESQELTYQVIRREWINVFEENESGGGRWTWTVNDIEVETGALQTDKNGVGGLSFAPPEGGTYKILTVGEDATGHETRSSLFVWASGPETVSWRRSNDDRMTLIPDKTEYVVGETARILIPSPYSEPHWALLTVERSGVLFREVMLLESNSTVIELPITGDHIPNIYVSVVLIRGLEAASLATDGSAAVAETKVGYAALTVSRDPKTLHITMQPSDEQPLPTTEIAYDLWVTDSYGNPIRTAVAFDLVDAAVLTLRPRTPNAILDAFYGLRGLGVSTSSGLTLSINRLVAEQLEELEKLDDEMLGDADGTVGAALAPMAMAEEAGAETGDVKRSSAADQLPEGIALRENFEDTAYWNGSIVTDEDGYARVIIQLPDNLTTWSARAVGVTLDTEVGEATDELLVTKPLLIRPVTTRFLVVGDRTRLLANVTNQTDHDLLAEVTLAQTGLVLEQAAVQTLTIPAEGEASVEWWCIVQDVSAVDVAFSVVSGELSDASRPRLTTGPDGTLLVYKYTSPEVVGTAGQLDEFGSRTEIIGLAPNLDTDRSELLIRLETSLAAAMQEGLDYLEHFEYECTEQVISRFLPNVLTYRAQQQLGIENPVLANKLPDLVAVGIERLYVRQNYDGGWGWWDIADSNPYLSAYAVYSLLQAERSGFEIRTDVLENGLEFLSRSLVSSKDLTSYVSANRQTWLAYVLAEGGRRTDALKAAEDLFENRAKLSHYARAWLALTLDLSDGASAAIETLLSDLYSDAIISATGAHWEETDYDWWAMNTDTRSTAVILDALVRLDPDQPLLPNIVRWLMVARKGGIWETTQETAWALIALTDWMVATEELAPTYDFLASINDVEIFEGQTNGTPLEAPIQLTIGAGDLIPDAAGNELTISRGEGSGRLYYTAHLTSYLPVEEIDALQRGIIVQRQYVSSSCAAGEQCGELDTVTAGEEIQVRLTIIAPHDLYYVVVEDPFPAGCEAIDPSLATTSLSATEPGLFRDTDDGWGWFYWWWWRWYSRSEFRDEKAVLFADYLPSGTYTFQYTLRAVVPGDYGVLPTFAQEFYFPEVFGRSAGRSLVIELATD
ncbi:Ig-like domain-containing protein [Candidatus Bipolaricaulota bacterium]